jgi:hypothetical protein
VQFDNGIEKECCSNMLRVKSMHEALHPDVVLPAATTAGEHRELEQSEEALADQEEAEPGEELEEDNIDNDNNDIPGDEETPSGMPGQLPSEVEQPKDFATIKRQVKEKIAAMVGQEVTGSTRSNGTIIWKVIVLNDPATIIPEKELSMFYGLKGFDLAKFKKA